MRKRNYFTKYSDAAQVVLNTLLDKYADAGMQEIESIQVLKLKPFDSMGTLPEIIKSGFGDRNGYNQAISELESEIYHLPPRFRVTTPLLRLLLPPRSRRPYC